MVGLRVILVNSVAQENRKAEMDTKNILNELDEKQIANQLAKSECTSQHGNPNQESFKSIKLDQKQIKQENSLLLSTHSMEQSQNQSQASRNNQNRQ